MNAEDPHEQFLRRFVVPVHALRLTQLSTYPSLSTANPPPNRSALGSALRDALIDDPVESVEEALAAPTTVATDVALLQVHRQRNQR